MGPPPRAWFDPFLPPSGTALSSLSRLPDCGRDGAPFLQPAARDQELHGPHSPRHIIQMSEDDALLPVRWPVLNSRMPSPAVLRGSYLRREDENRGSSETHLHPGSFQEPLGSLPKRVGSQSTEIYLTCLYFF